MTPEQDRARELTLLENLQGEAIDRLSDHLKDCCGGCPYCHEVFNDYGNIHAASETADLQAQLHAVTILLRASVNDETWNGFPKELKDVYPAKLAEAEAQVTALRDALRASRDRFVILRNRLNAAQLHATAQVAIMGKEAIDAALNPPDGPAGSE